MVCYNLKTDIVEIANAGHQPALYRKEKDFREFPSETTPLAIVKQTNSNVYKLNTPSLDPILLSINIWGKFYYIGALLSAFERIFPIAVIIVLYKKYKYFYYFKSNLLPLFAVFLNYFPFINIFVLINIITFLP